MNRILLISLLISAPPLLAKEASYLGADRADILAGLRLYTEKQLADMKRKERGKELPQEPATTKEEDSEPEEQKQNWDDEIEKLLRAETKRRPEPEIPQLSEALLWVPQTQEPARIR